MTIKTTPKKIGEANAAITALLGAKLPVKAAYAVSKLGKACQAEMEDFSKAREKIFTDAGCTVRDNKYHHDEKEKLDAAIKLADELSDAEVEIAALPLDIEQFGNAELPGHAFLGLDWAMKPEPEAA